MKSSYLLLLFSVLLTLNSHSESSQKSDSIISNLRYRINVIEHSAHIKDSLYNELIDEVLVARAKESTFAEINSENITTFYTILSLVLAIVGIFVTFISYQWRKNTKKDFEKTINRELKEVKGFNDKVKESLNKTIIKSYKTAANTNYTISRILEKEHKFAEAMIYTLNSASDRVLSKKEEEQQIVTTSLDNAITLFKLSSSDINDIIILKTWKESYLGFLLVITKSELIEVKDKCAELRVLLNSI